MNEIKKIAEKYADRFKEQLYLNAGDIWKIGETTRGKSRYSPSSYEYQNFRKVRAFSGTTTKLLILEKLNLYYYFFTHCELPPGNKVFK